MPQFLSPQMHQINCARAASHTVPYLREPNMPLQDSSIETTEFAITQGNPTRQDCEYRVLLGFCHSLRAPIHSQISTVKIKIHNVVLFATV